MAAFDSSFQAIGPETLAECWPAFAVAAAANVWLVRRIRRARRYPLEAIVAGGLVPAAVATGLLMESVQATNLVYQTVGEGARADWWMDLKGHLARTWPLFVPLAAVLFGLVAHPRSHGLVAGLVATAGVLVSWIVAMWLYVNSHHDMVGFVLRLPGGTGVVAAIIGFPVTTALWMAIGRWIWRRQRPHRGITARADADVPRLRG